MVIDLTKKLFTFCIELLGLKVSKLLGLLEVTAPITTLVAFAYEWEACKVMVET